MGAVYEVEHLLTGHHRALKVVHKRYADQQRFMTRLLREARVAGQLATPYVVETLDAGRLEDGSAYILMELLGGRSFLQLIRAEGRLSVPVVAHIMAQVCDGIAVAHEAGIIHRDLKPENIFLARRADRSEGVKILDFGISKFPVHLQEAPDRLTAEGTILGTPFYMSPEQAAGKPLDELTDIYAIGVMMYEALTGRLPFEAKTVGALFFKIGAGEYFPITHYLPDVDPAFAEIVHRAIHRDRSERFQSAEALREALAPFAGEGEELLRESTPDLQLTTRAVGGAVAERPTSDLSGDILQSFTRTEPSIPPGAIESSSLEGVPHTLAEGMPSDEGRGTGGGLPVWIAVAAVAVLGAVLVPVLIDRGAAEEAPPAASAPASADVDPVASSTPDPAGAALPVAATTAMQAREAEASAGPPRVSPVAQTESAMVGEPDAGPSHSRSAGHRRNPDRASRAGLLESPY